MKTRIALTYAAAFLVWLLALIGKLAGASANTAERMRVQ